MNETMNNVANEAAVEVVKEVAKNKPDLMHAGVIGLCVAGGISIAAGIVIGTKKIYNHFAKKKDVLDEFEDDFDEDLTDEDIEFEEKTEK